MSRLLAMFGVCLLVLLVIHGGYWLAFGGPMSWVASVFVGGGVGLCVSWVMYP